MTRIVTLPARFWAKVDKTETCWIWTAAVDRGYGKFRWHGSMSAAHRVAYEVLVGPIPDGFTLDHVAERCGSKLCVNPDHLEPVTRGDNVRRYYALVTHCGRGHPLAVVNHKRGVRGCRVCRRQRQARRALRIRLGDQAPQPERS